MEIRQSDIDCSSAEEFLNALSPVGPVFQNDSPNSPWIFRGQGQDWPLIPSLFRPILKLPFLLNGEFDYDKRLLLFRDLLTQFFEIADKRGLILPDDSQQLSATIETIGSEWGDAQLTRGFAGAETLNSLASLEALAQHNGIPTRLIDWTRHPFIASYFAAEDATKSVYPVDSRLVVWALYVPFMGKHYAINKLSDPISVVTAPTATNSNLKAQQGVFTLSHYFYETEEAGNYIPLEEMLVSKARTADPTLSDSDRQIVSCVLRKFSLPVKEANVLLYLLAKFDITPSAIYPGLHSILRDIEMRNSWAVRRPRQEQ